MIRDYLPAIGCLMVMIVVILGSWVFLPEQVPLWFTYPWGEGQLAPKLLLLTLPGIGLGTIAANLVITKAFPKGTLLLGKVLNVAATLVNIMLLFAIIGILQSLL